MKRLECFICGVDLGELEDGDVTMCTRCEQWHDETCPITRQEAAELARKQEKPRVKN